jgi:hypothetical protein
MGDIASDLVANFLGRDDSNLGNHSLVLVKITSKVFSMVFEDFIVKSLDFGFPRFTQLFSLFYFWMLSP